MKRKHSLIGPLLLIAFGALFLINNLHPELPLMEIIIRDWPFILIIWGVARLGEILYWAATDRPLPRNGISGGEWAVIVILCLMGSGMFFARRITSHWPEGRITMRGIEVFGEPFDFPVSAQKPTGKAPRVIIENLRGNARVIGVDVDEVNVTGTKTIKALKKDDAAKDSERSPLDVLTQGDQVIIRTNQDRVASNANVKVDLDIKVPRGASIEARGRYGDFDITDVSGAIEIASDNAGVRIQNTSSAVRLDLKRSDIVRIVNAKGTVDVKGGRSQDLELENIEGLVAVAGSFSGEMTFRNLSKPMRFESSQTNFRVERIPGQVRIALGNITGTNLVGPIHLTGKSKDVQLTDFTQSIEIAVDRGDIDLRPGRLPLSKIDAHTKGGNLELALPPNAKFELRALAKRGDVQNDWGAGLKYEPDRAEKSRGASLSGVVGGGALITVATERGTITVKKAEPEKPGTTPAEKPEKPAVVVEKPILQ